MIASKQIKRVLIMILMMGLYPMIGWAGPIQLTDGEMDAIYAQGIFVDIDFSVIFPGGGVMNMPSVNVPFPNVGGASGSLNNGGSGKISVLPSNSNSTPLANATGKSTPTAIAGNNVGSVPNRTPTEIAGNNVGSVPNSTPTTITANNSGSNPNSVQNVIPVAAGVSITKGAMQGNSGLIINAPAAAVSIIINIASFHNSVLNGDFSQNASSIPTTMLMSFSTAFHQW